MWFLPIILLLLPQAVRFETSTDLVIVDVTVRDRSGNLIEGLKKEDFAVLEDGKPQTISVFEYQSLALDPLPPRTLVPRPPAPVEAPITQDPTPKTQPPTRYRDKRLLVLFFDFSSMPPADQIRAQQSALKFLSEKMTSSDVVSILTFSTRLKVVQEFTEDRQKLAEIIRNFRIGEASDLAGEADTGEEEGEETGAAFVADQTEFNIFNTDRKLSALESAVKRLAPLPERKALVYFSSGVGKTGVENQSQLRATVNAAVRSNVAFYPIDARGLVATAPGGDASQAAPRGSSIFSGSAQARQRDRFNNQQETLYTLAADTGGKALLDSNDLSLGIAQAQQDVRSYYIVGYYSTNPAQDGRYRRIRVTLAGQPQAKLDFRSGYFAGKKFGQFSSDDKERQLEEALALGDPITDLPLALEVNYFRLGRERYFVPVAVKIPGSEISLVHRGAREETEFDFIGQVKDAKGRIVANVRDGIKVKLDQASASQLGHRHLQYDTGFTLPPGPYRLKFLTRENRTGKMGTFEVAFEIPDVTAESKSLRLSSVVWANQREPLAAAVGAADNQKKLLARHPLIHDGQKLVPSITRVFRKDQTLYVYFEVYDPGLDSERRTPGLAASLSFFRDRTKTFETTPIRISQATTGRPGVAPFQFQLPLAPLAPGQYTCQVNVVDEVGRKFSFPRARLVLLP
jgi:VWFA-related protein